MVIMQAKISDRMGRTARRGDLAPVLLFCAFLFATTCLSSPAQAAQECKEPIPSIFQRVSPAVVLVSAVTIDPFKVTGRFSSMVGSGFIISSGGTILTNSHLVYGAQSITVGLGGQTQTAVLLGADPILDLAALKITAPSGGLPVLKLGDSDTLRVGQEIIAIGNPLGLEQTLVHGLVSGINRILPVAPMSMLLPMIQADAAINPGHSGGPLLNRCGEVVGVTTSMMTGAESIGFAIPINVARQVMQQLIRDGRVIRPWLGVRGRLIRAKGLKAIFNLPLVDGFLVETVDPASPAETAGVRGGELPIVISGEEYLFGGDIITMGNGSALDEQTRFDDFVRSLKVGDSVRLIIHREGREMEVTFSLPERPILPGDISQSESTQTLAPLIPGHFNASGLRMRGR
jgi:serine protease Do